jgi:hypothetical protein
VLAGSKIVRGRKNRTNIRKQVVKNAKTLYHTIRRRVLKTLGSGADSTTPAGAFGAGFAGTLASGGAATDVCFSGLLSTSNMTPAFAAQNLAHTSTP